MREWAGKSRIIPGKFLVNNGKIPGNDGKLAGKTRKSEKAGNNCIALKSDLLT